MDALLFDARHLKSGIGAYSKGLISEYNKNSEIKITYIGEKRKLLDLGIMEHSILDSTVPIYSAKEQLEIYKFARKWPLLHVPHYNIPLFYQNSLITTIHDISHLVLKEIHKGFLKRLYARIMIYTTLARSKVVITDSLFTKNEILKLFNVNPEKINVIHLGINEEFVNSNKDHTEKDAEVIRKFEINSPYILFVGNVKAHKNITTLIAAYNVLVEKFGIKHKLVIAGHSDEILDTKPGVIYINNCDNTDLISLYKNADLYCILSLYEGFGFTPLEAMNFGIPTVVSDIECHREVLKNATQYVKLNDINLIAECIYKTLIDKDLRNRLSKDGLNLSKMYRWKNTAEKTIDIYRNIFKLESK